MILLDYFKFFKQSYYYIFKFSNCFNKSKNVSLIILSSKSFKNKNLYL